MPVGFGLLLRLKITLLRVVNSGSHGLITYRFELELQSHNSFGDGTLFKLIIFFLIYTLYLMVFPASTPTVFERAHCGRAIYCV